MDYKEAGVDLEAGREFVRQIRANVESTYRAGVLGGLGGFGGCFQLPPGYDEPVLVSGTDGVGTKLEIAQVLNRHDTIGIDLVAMCVNDVLTSGAEPLFFLDYIATGTLAGEQLAQVVEGIAAGCRQSGCALLGGETAEMPGFYAPGAYDLAGFCVGVVEKRRLLDGSRVRVGDVAIALASSGLHSNGFSLVRKIVQSGEPASPRDRGWCWQDTPPEFGGKSLGEVALEPTRIYVQPVLDALQTDLDIRGLAHITGGGLPENLPRCLHREQSLCLDPHAWDIPPIFHWLATAGDVASAEMFNTFNMGVGMVAIVPPEQGDRACHWLIERGIPATAIGEVVPGDGRVLGLPD